MLIVTGNMLDSSAPACQLPDAAISARQKTFALFWCFSTKIGRVPHRIIATALSVNTCGMDMPFENLINPLLIGIFILLPVSEE
ncbi:hypothetical protein BG74_08955 [Sodalis-like endosymbiont of Proechinophthirus fluctus]|uniref:hypothetical protein n=1 Tax=Sodalis-like endosymbiont of Proechinophthirus fluctus TaxID=1462730 RepID=UPI0007A7E23C|nr:hypothetical protein [Sodalis-like endosymbiont of Proechinophthirus fluctus]KYP95418.1 hypothetical protein BG74_08955 [Sodalis-like endosymbiont of Proechinophthirus fluctus]